jgi:hypothetical protein
LDKTVTNGDGHADYLKLSASRLLVAGSAVCVGDAQEEALEEPPAPWKPRVPGMVLNKKRRR